MEIPREFNIVLRGYSCREVDALMRRALEAQGSPDPALRAAVRDELRSAGLSVSLRGYDRAQVDGVIHGLVEQLGVPGA
ncbi:hypothetical protein [Rugosimonospora acidiphila]